MTQTGGIVNHGGIQGSVSIVLNQGRWTMKLSEAIRLGAMLRPKDAMRYWTETGSCSIGAALEAVGEIHGVSLHLDPRYVGCLDPYTRALQKYWPWVTSRIVLDITIVTIHQTREAVADWVASIEPLETPPPSRPTLERELQPRAESPSRVQDGLVE